MGRAGDAEQGPGFWVTHQDTDATGNFFVYENSRDERPWKHLQIPQGSRAFVQVCATWQGRVVRGQPAVNTDGKPHNLGTWFESNVDDDGTMWGDVSLLEGSAGGGSVAATDGSGVSKACLQDMLGGALSTKETGTKAIAKIVGDGANGAAKGWDLGKCSRNQVWIENLNPGDVNPVIGSMGGRLEFVFYKGKA